MGGRTVAVTWEGRPVEAWLPDPVAGATAPEVPSVVRATEQAAAAVRRMGERATGPMEAAARLLLRSEGLASSAIEGLRVGADQLAVALVEANDGPAGGDVVADVAGNLLVLTEALRVPGPLVAEDLLAWHERLMANATVPPELVGTWRDRVGWVGGATPLVAAHVAAPAEEIGALVDDLLVYVARADLDPVTKAAVAHAQFETIHPFADGNGRLGRALVGWILGHGLAVAVPPPVSVALARDIGGYLAGLTLFRQGDVDRWVSWFAGTVERSATLTAAILDQVGELQGDWRARLTDLRADATARRVLEDLPAHPAMTATLVAERRAVSDAAARSAIGLLAERGILTTVIPSLRARPGRRPHWYVAHDLLVLLGG